MDSDNPPATLDIRMSLTRKWHFRNARETSPSIHPPLGVEETTTFTCNFQQGQVYCISWPWTIYSPPGLQEQRYLQLRMNDSGTQAITPRVPSFRNAEVLQNSLFPAHLLSVKLALLQVTSYSGKASTLRALSGLLSRETHRYRILSDIVSDHDWRMDIPMGLVSPIYIGNHSIRWYHWNHAYERKMAVFRYQMEGGARGHQRNAPYH